MGGQCGGDVMPLLKVGERGYCSVPGSRPPGEVGYKHRERQRGCHDASPSRPSREKSRCWFRTWLSASGPLVNAAEPPRAAPRGLFLRTLTTRYFDRFHFLT